MLYRLDGVYVALITEAAGHRGLGRATGGGLTAIYGGAAVLPPLLGGVKDLTHSWSAAWEISIGAVLLAAAILAMSPRRVVRPDSSEETVPLEAPPGTVI